MSRFIYSGILAILLSCTTSTLAADQTHGIYGKHGGYVAISAGAVFPTDSKQQSYQGANLIDNNVNLGIGPETNIALGMYVGHLRFEGEFGYHTNDVTGADFPALRASTTASGHIDSYSLMANGYWDVPVRNGIQWYIGLGAGAAREHAHTTVTIQGFSPLVSDGNAWVPAFQVMTGVAFRIAPKVHLNIGYRYWTTTNPTFNGSTFDAPGDNTAEVGLRFDF